MQKVYDFFTDPAHGWLAVKKQILTELEIASKITSFSYQRGDTAYLEENCDLSIFFNAFENKTGAKPVLEHHHTDRSSRIRNYESYCFEAGSAQ